MVLLTESSMVIRSLGSQRASFCCCRYCGTVEVSAVSWWRDEGGLLTAMLKSQVGADYPFRYLRSELGGSQVNSHP